jgi:hypothetical protein
MVKLYGGSMKNNPLLIAALALAILGCSDATSGTDTENGSESLAWSVYAGEDAAGSWATFAFTKDEDNMDVVYYFPDNAACYYGSYEYQANGSGSIMSVKGAARSSSETGAPGPVPGLFVISADGKTITFSDYAGEGSRSFPRRRGKGGEREADDPPPAGLNAVAASLDGTVWAATAYRTRDWTTLVVTGMEGNPAAGTITVSHSFDCTSFPRNYKNYAYDTASFLDYIGTFSVTAKSGMDEFTFLNFYGHGGTISLKRMR